MSTRRVALLSLAFLLSTTRGVTVADATLHLDVAMGLVTRGSPALSIDPGDVWVEDRPVAGALFYFGDDGLRTPLPPGMSWLAVPTVAIGTAVAWLEDAPPLATRLQPAFHDSAPSLRALLRPINRDPRAIGLCVLGPVSGALAVLFAMLTARALTGTRADSPPRTRAEGWTALFLMTSPLAVYAGTTWTQPLLAAALAFAMLRVVSGGARWPLGVALAIAAAVRLDHAPVALLFVVADQLGPERDRGWRRRTRELAATLLPLAGVLVLLAAWGLPRPVAGAWSWSRLPVGAIGLLISPLTGLLIYAPFVALVPFARPPLRAPGSSRSTRALALAAAVLAYELLLYGGWQDWDATFAYGPRFLVPALPLLAPLAAARVTPARRAWAAIALAAGALVTVPGVLVAHPRIPEDHHFFHPAFVSAWRTLLHGAGAIGAHVDCAATYAPFYAVAALVVLGIAALDRARVRR